MNFTNYTRIAVATGLLMAAGIASADEFSFKIINGTDSTIRKILVSENGRQYGFFDIGRGVKPGATVELVWDSSTDGEACEQYVKAVFADGSESEAAVFDFCEEDLVLEFDE